MKNLIFIIFFINTIFAFDIDIKNPDVKNGQTLLVEIQKENSIEFEKVWFKDKFYKIYQSPIDTKKLYALVPISYYEKPDIQELKIQYKIDEKIKNAFFMLEIKDGKYKKEKITVSAKKVNPTSKDVLKRTKKEYANAMKIYNTITEDNFIKSKFILPLDSKITSDFGKARVYNGSLKGYHSGTDFRAKKPTPIKATNDGKVVLAKNRFYAGNSVIINHGRGIYSCYYHLSKFKVKKGDIVTKGQIIGLSGSTGRITGPHLHFAFRVEGMQVDPLQFISLMNDNILKMEKK
jgi:murein DD-endopeptidase MepM/ murein hydrolase activator NlpD